MVNRTELTPIGEQYVIPGCERDTSRGPKQGNLWDAPQTRWLTDAQAREAQARGAKVAYSNGEGNVRARLSHLWGLDRALTQAEFGRILRLGGVRPDHSVRDYESGKTQVSGPLSLLIELLLAGARPAGLDATIEQLKK